MAGDAVLKGFRDFITKGNVIDLAVAVVIGAAFIAVVNAVVEGLITPLIAAIFGEPDLNEVGTFTINGAHFSIGLILTAMINFLLVAAAVYFVLIAPMNAFVPGVAGHVCRGRAASSPRGSAGIAGDPRPDPGPPERDLTTGQLGSGDSTPAG